MKLIDFLIFFSILFVVIKMIMDGKKVSLEIKNKLKNEIELCNNKPSLCVVSVGNNDASNIYIRNKENACKYIGMNFRHYYYEEGRCEKEIVNKINELNNDSTVDGIICQLPMPDMYDERNILNKISYLKDVDGLTDINIGHVINGNDGFVPCTPKGIMYLLDFYKIKLKGKHVVVVGRSDLVAKPVFQECLKKDATVTICHSKTKNLGDYTRSADILIVAVGKKNLIKENMVKDGVIIVDVGINKVNGKIYGDVSINAKRKSSMYTPVPGGVGPMTVAMLLVNTFISYKNKNL